MALTLAEANRILEGAVAKAEELGIKVNVAVCDDGGRLKAFARMDGAGWAGMYGSQGKAVASAATGRASGDLQERADTPIYRGIVAAEGGAHDPEQGRSANYPRRPDYRRLRRGRRNLRRRRSVRQCRRIPGHRLESSQ